MTDFLKPGFDVGQQIRGERVAIKGNIAWLGVGWEIRQRLIIAFGLARLDEIEFSLIKKQFTLRFCKHPLFEIGAMVGLVARHPFRRVTTPLLTV